MDLSKNNVRILIIRLSSLGDVLLTTPIIRSIKKQYPNTVIDYLIKGQYRNVLNHNKYISEIINYNDLRNGKRTIEIDLKKNNYDLIIDLQNSFRSRKIKRLLKKPYKQFNKHNISKFMLVHFKINKLSSLPQIPVRYAETIYNLQLDDKGLDLFLPENINSELPDEKKYIGFAPGSKHFTKMWPIKYYIEFGKELLKNNYQIVLFGGNDDKEICDEINEQLPDSINFCNDNNIFNTAINMKKCSAIVCNDSGLMHVASAVGVPTLSIFGSTVKEFGFTPYKNQNLILENNSLNCRPCSHIGSSKCPKEHFKCMKEITPNMAFAELKKLLNNK